MDILLAWTAIDLRASPGIRHALRRVAAGRPMRIGFVSTVVRGWTIGDLTVDFGAERLRAGDLEVAPLGDVPVAIDRRLLVVLRRGATIRRRFGWARASFAIALDHPEDWLDFLDGRPVGMA